MSFVKSKKKEEGQILDDQEIFEVRMGGAGQYFERGQQVEEGQSLLLRRVNSAR